VFFFSSKKTIERNTLFYILLRFYTRICFRCFYRNIHYTGWEHIPKNGPVIFAPNHQNALMDALAVLLWQKKPVVFLARADIFKKKFIGKLLRLIKIMPVYRMKDGYSKLTKNERQFKEAACVLINNGYLCLMPEGGQDGHRRLRLLVKGLFRIAFEAQLAVEKSRDVQIVPVGIDYSRYEHAGSDLVVHFGETMLVSDYIGFYEQDPVLGINTLRDHLAGRMKSLIIDIQNTEYYEEIYGLSRLLSPAYIRALALKNSAINRFEARLRLSDRLEDFFKNPEEQKQAVVLKEFHSIYEALPGTQEEKYCLSDDLRKKLNRKTALYLFAALALTPAYLINWPIRKIIQAIIKLDKDPQMHCSFRFALSALMLPLWYLTLSLLPALLLKWCLIKASIFFLVLLFVACFGERFIPAFSLELRLWRLLHKQPSDLRAKLISALDKLEELCRDFFVA